MHTIKNLFCLVVVILMLASCNNDDKVGSLTLHFSPSFQGSPLKMFEPLDFTGASYDIRFSHLSMFVSDIELRKGSSIEVLSDVELVDMSFDDVTSAEEGFTIHFDQVPAQTYNEIKFGIGVPPDQNDQTPSEFPSGNPLSNTGYYWQAWLSYIFMKVEGQIETAQPGNFETNFAYHTGTDGLYRVFSTPIPIEINDGQNTDVFIEFDFADVLNNVDIESEPQNHNPQDSVQIGQIVNNLQSSITLFQ